jgi:hypothetical protein
MSYSPITDFLGLLRATGGGVRTARMPGLDWLIEALQRVGFVNVSIGQTAPTTNQPTTAWFQPALPTWSAEGTLFLWNAAVGAYQPATPALWNRMLSPSGYTFQSAPNANNIITAGTSLLAVQRAAPVATALVLPNLAAQFNFGKDVNIIDFSTGVANHAITITTPDGSTIMQDASWELLSTAAQLAGIRLKPSPDLNAWIIAP